MIRPEAAFHEAEAEPRIEALPLSHLSIELGHLYFDDFAEGPDRLRRQFSEVAPWVAASRDIYARGVSGRSHRVSTCFLIDDYFGPSSSPALVLPQLLDAARDSGLSIDYLVRESACADADGVPLARLVEDRIVADPAPGTNGSRPPVKDTGWLSNGQRSPLPGSAQAMAGEVSWAPPVQNSANRHSVFVDVELWDESQRGRRWSCAFLAAIWQLLRLGLLRYAGRAVAVPQPWEGEFPDEWARLPAVVKVNPSAAPFSAYRTLSILSGRFMPTEHAVRTILSQVAIDQAVAAEAVDRAQAEDVPLPLEAVDRIDYIFVS